METRETNDRIKSKIEKLDGQQLRLVSDFISELTDRKPKEINLTQHIEKIMSEYDSVLRRLAQ